MLEQEDQNQIQARRSKMKAINYHQQLQLKMMKKVFSELKNNWISKVERYRSYYQMILYIKSFKGIMEYGMIQKEQKIEADNQRIQQSFKKEDERQLLSEVKLLRRYILKGRLKKFTVQIRLLLTAKQIKRRKALELLQREKQEQEQNRKKQEQFNIKAKTQEAFNRRPLISEKGSDFKYMTSIAGNSRKEYSPTPITTRQINASRRKYVPIKVLPPKPSSIPHLQQKIDNDASNKARQQNIKQESFNISEDQQQITYSKQSKPSLEDSDKRQSSPKKMVDAKEEQKVKENCRQRNIKIRQNTLAILSELKMIEIISINQIIEQYSQVFKRQTFSNQKNYIKESIKLLEKIKLIE